MQSIDDAVKEANALLLKDESIQLEDSIQGYILRSVGSGLAVIASLVVWGTLAGSEYNNSFSRVLITPAMLNVVYFGYQAVKNYQLLLTVWNRFSDIEAELDNRGY